MNKPLVIPFSSLKREDVSLVGGKNSSLGELMNALSPLGIRVPDGFATTADAFRLFLSENGLREKLAALMDTLDRQHYTNLQAVSMQAKECLLQATLPQRLCEEIMQHYQRLSGGSTMPIDVAVRSSATAEDLPTASFAGQHESFLNVRGAQDVLQAVQRCFASLYNARAIKYRIDQGFAHDQVALSAGVQRMVRADLSSSGVCFTLDPDSGFSNVVVITACWGLGENIVQGTVTPDEFHVFKPTLGKASTSILNRKMGSKAKTLVYSASGTVNTDTPQDKQTQWTLRSDEVHTLAEWSVKIEAHYGMPMDIEWAKDGLSNELFIVQARPETVHSARNALVVKEFTMLETATPLLQGLAVGKGIARGVARVLRSPAEADKLQQGEILVTEYTNPDWDPVLKKAAAIITCRGGRTSHAAIVARELGALALVGAASALDQIQDGDLITVDQSQGKLGTVYAGALNWTEKEMDFSRLSMPKVKPMLILADPDKAYPYSFYPNQGVGLMRLEFVINNSIRIHPMALVKPELASKAADREALATLTAGYDDPKEYFIDKLAQAVGTLAAAFYPKEVIVRMSDFKSNEYANLIGGTDFEPHEENPMIGFRGASRYYHPRYKEGFALECAAMKRVRDEMGLHNVKLMIPFCRTVEEGQNVLAQMQAHGLRRGENGLEMYVMAEIPSNVILAKEFAALFDGFSIGSNDLTQLTLGIDRDSDLISDLFDENNAAVKSMIAHMIRSAKACGAKIGLCGQAPSDDPSFARFLVELGIDSISFNPDALYRGIENMYEAEKGKMKGATDSEARYSF